LNHDAENKASLVQLGFTGDGTPALINRLFVEADVKIVTGFIEPHFFAGFSGGPKGIMPGVAGFETVLSNHGSRNLGHPNATFGVTNGNPLWEELRDIALRTGPAFLLNVALNRERQITAVFAGDLLQAHAVGCEFVKRFAMVGCPEPFDVVVTTNSGYPLDLNLYQGVKGISAGARIVKPGGTLILACECSEGVPPGSSCERILHSASSAEGLLELLSRPGPTRPEQWQAQIMALAILKAKILLYSSLAAPTVRAVHLEPCADIARAATENASAAGRDAKIAVLPEGPLTIPYLA
jgi:nickel-dependent lactate racemase